MGTRCKIVLTLNDELWGEGGHINRGYNHDNLCKMDVRF